MDAATWALAIAVFVAAVVEAVEAMTIVVAMGMTRSWRSTLLGVAAALVALALFTAAAGYALATWLPEAGLKIVIGSLLLVFGLQWLRKAILRSAGRKGRHDEEAIFAEQTAEARQAGHVSETGIDWFSFVVSFKGVFLEGVEVVFIVITFGLSAGNMPVAIASATLGLLAVVALGFVVRGPLARVPENTLKYGVAILLATFGTYWAFGGLGIFVGHHDSLEWPGTDLAILVLIVWWLAVSRLLVALLRVRHPGPVRTESSS